MGTATDTPPFHADLFWKLLYTPRTFTKTKHEKAKGVPSLRKGACWTKLHRDCRAEAPGQGLEEGCHPPHLSPPSRAKSTSAPALEPGPQLGGRSRAAAPPPRAAPKRSPHSPGGRGRRRVPKLGRHHLSAAATTAAVPAEHGGDPRHRQAPLAPRYRVMTHNNPDPSAGKGRAEGELSANAAMLWVAEAVTPPPAPPGCAGRLRRASGLVASFETKPSGLLSQF